MSTATQQRRPPLSLFPDKPTPRLYDRVVDVLRVRHYSRRTEDAYVHWMRRYIEFHRHQHPRQLAEGDDVRTTMIYTHEARRTRRSQPGEWAVSRSQ
jgi:hypothetical protein